MMKRWMVILAVALTACQMVHAEEKAFGKGSISTKMVARNAVRISYTEGVAQDTLPDWVYVKHSTVENSDISVQIDQRKGVVSVKDKKGRTSETIYVGQY
jgi:hypothetical protein